jgi:ribosomal protein S12 methylthiotransferase accessory factor
VAGRASRAERPSLASHPHLQPDRSLAGRKQGDYPCYPAGDLRADVALCVDLAAQQGLETLVLDQTRPDVGLRVVKVIVPGLRPHRPRFGPGRLYEVPVKLGWRAAALAEEEMDTWSLPV